MKLRTIASINQTISDDSNNEGVINDVDNMVRIRLY